MVGRRYSMTAGTGDSELHGISTQEAEKGELRCSAQFLLCPLNHSWTPVQGLAGATHTQGGSSISR